MAGFLKRLYQRWRVPQSAISRAKRTVLFYRDFQGFTGGHLKVWHYFNHVQYSPQYQAHIAFSAATHWDDSNPWLALRGQALPTWQPERADVLFIAGMDWGILSPAQRQVPPRPVINLIQHVRHADPEQALYAYLEHRAIRICVSAPVAQALQASSRVNGPILTINNGLDCGEFPPVVADWAARQIDLLIVGIKQPALALDISQHLQGLPQRIEVLTTPIARADFLQRLGNSKIALLLPHVTEGFYLPALEGFALGTLVICPDCVGNRSFCRPAENCLQPPYSITSLVAALHHALHMTAEQRCAMQQAAQRTAQQHSLAQERQAFLEILHDIDAIW